MRFKVGDIAISVASDLLLGLTGGRSYVVKDAHVASNMITIENDHQGLIWCHSSLFILKETPVSLEVTEDIERPQRYNKGSIEVWDFILDQSMGFLEGNIIKYISRYKEKGGIKDLEKAKVYLDKLIEETKKNE